MSFRTEWKNWKIKLFDSEQYDHNRIEFKRKRDGINWNEGLVPSAVRQCLCYILGKSTHSCDNISHSMHLENFLYQWTKRRLLSPQKSEHKNSEYFSQFSLIFIYEKNPATTLKSIVDGCVFRMCRKTMQEVTEPSIYFVCWLQTQFYFNCTLKQIISTKMMQIMSTMLYW